MRIAGVYIRTGTLEPGRYGVDDQGYFSLTLSKEVCPYCFGIMDEGLHDGRTILRYVEINEKAREVSADVLPATHRAFKCEPCNQIFTTLKENLSGSQ